VKKLIAMIATVAVVLSLGANAFAAGVEVVDKIPYQSPEEEKITVSIVGHENDIQVNGGAKYLDSHEYEKLKDLVDDNEMAFFKIIEAEVGDKYSVENGVVSTTDYDAAQLVLDEGEFKFAFGFDAAADVTNVFVFSDANDAWVEITGWSLSDGKIIVPTSDDYTFAFKFYETTADADADAAADNKTADSKKKSAATGYNSTAYIVCAIALAAGAAFFFGTSKKSAKEMM